MNRAPWRVVSDIGGSAYDLAGVVLKPSPVPNLEIEGVSVISFRDLLGALALHVRRGKSLSDILPEIAWRRYPLLTEQYESQIAAAGALADRHYAERGGDVAFTRCGKSVDARFERVPIEYGATSSWFTLYYGVWRAVGTPIAAPLQTLLQKLYTVAVLADLI